MLQERMYTVSQASEFLQVTEETVLTLIHKGRLNASNIGKGVRRPRWRILSSDLGLFLAANRSQQPASPPSKRRQSKASIAKDYFGDSK